MKRILRNALILTMPFLIMIVVNEIVRPTIKEKRYTKNGITAINSAIQTKQKCSWNCHNNTAYCKQNHIKLVRPIENYIDLIYFGMIFLLQATGNYGLANIIFLVILWPLLMYWLLIKSLDIQARIKSNKK